MPTRSHSNDTQVKNKDILGYGSALGAAFFWSFSFIWFKIAYRSYQPITVVLFRLTISAVLILTLALYLKRLQKIHPKDLKLFFLMSFFEPFVYFLGESYGLKYISSTAAAVIVATIPLLTPLAAWYFHKEKIRWMNFAGMMLSFVGVAMVVLNRSFRFEASPLGVSLEFCAVLAAIGYAIVLKNLAPRYNTFTIIAWQNIFGIFLFLPLWLILDFKSFLHTPYDPTAFRAIVLLAIFSSTLAFVFFTQSIRKLGVNRSNTFVNLIPGFVAVLSFFILNDPLTLQHMAGITVVVCGLFLAQIKRKRPGKPKKAFEIHTV
jgi:drug/metabolite transporter (DMT)-like permease